MYLVVKTVGFVVSIVDPRSEFEMDEMEDLKTTFSITGVKYSIFRHSFRLTIFCG